MRIITPSCEKELIYAEKAALSPSVNFSAPVLQPFRQTPQPMHRPLSIFAFIFL
jgi:hypothetical protein